MKPFPSDTDLACRKADMFSWQNGLGICLPLIPVQLDLSASKAILVSPLIPWAPGWGWEEDSGGNLTPEESSLCRRVSVSSWSEGSVLKKVPLKVLVLFQKFPCMGYHSDWTVPSCTAGTAFASDFKAPPSSSDPQGCLGT